MIIVFLRSSANFVSFVMRLSDNAESRPDVGSCICAYTHRYANRNTHMHTRTHECIHACMHTCMESCKHTSSVLFRLLSLHFLFLFFLLSVLLFLLPSAFFSSSSPSFSSPFSSLPDKTENDSLNSGFHTLLFTVSPLSTT